MTFKLPLAESIPIKEEDGPVKERKHSVSPLSSARKDTSRKSYDRKLITPLVLNMNRRYEENG